MAAILPPRPPADQRATPRTDRRPAAMHAGEAHGYWLCGQRYRAPALRCKVKGPENRAFVEPAIADGCLLCRQRPGSREQATPNPLPRLGKRRRNRDAQRQQQHGRTDQRHDPETCHRRQQRHQQRTCSDLQNFPHHICAALVSRFAEKCLRPPSTKRRPSGYGRHVGATGSLPSGIENRTGRPGPGISSVILHASMLRCNKCWRRCVTYCLLPGIFSSGRRSIDSPGAPDRPAGRTPRSIEDRERHRLPSQRHKSGRT